MKFSTLFPAFLLACSASAQALTLFELSEYVNVRQVLNTYSLALDSKNATALTAIFTTNGSVNFTSPTSPPQIVTGSTTISSFLLDNLEGVITQHALTTQRIDVANGTAFAVTYFTDTHFGQGNSTGDLVTYYGRYDDNLVDIPGSSFQIQSRTVFLYGPTEFYTY
ncbi:hypothetical protein MMC20_004044 [Loxospora ochrophaea]|nr:hypothetical protein [Loxospora ochrophaea]